MRCACPPAQVLSVKLLLGLLVCLAMSPTLLPALETEILFADYDDQGFFNNFSGDSGVFANGPATVTVSFATNAFHGRHGASLRIDYNVPSGFCGVWNSLLGRDSYPKYTLNFTNLYGLLRNSPANPSRVENVRVAKFSFWARGNGRGEFDHQVKVELKALGGIAGSKVFAVPNHTNWTRYDFSMGDLTGDCSQMKEAVFVIESSRNDSRSNHFFIDNLSFTTDELPATPGHWNDDAMLDAISQRAFGYFLTFTDDLGFALDRSTFSDMVSVGTIGFQLTAYCIGHQRGWADRQDVENRVVTVLRNLNKLPMGPETGTDRAGYRGFYYHFLNANTGLRKDPGVELSIYDTALLMYGVLSCKEYFRTNTEVQALSRQLFDRVEWDWFVDHLPGPNSNQFHLAWMPGPAPKGTFTQHIDGFTDEALMVDIVALGSPTHPVAFETYVARNRVSGTYPPAQGIMVSWQGSLFNYFFGSCWLDLQAQGSDLHPTISRDIWQNHKMAIRANRQFCIDHAAERPGGANDRYATYGRNVWGLTASDTLVGPASRVAGQYHAFGALPSEENVRFGTKARHCGTIAVYGAASSINFLPEASLAALRHYFEIPRLWSPMFGFGDAFSLDPHYFGSVYDANGNPQTFYADYLNGPWVNHSLMGVNVGPMLLAIENYRSRQIWDLTGKNPEIQAGLARIFGLGSPANYTATNERGATNNRIHLKWDPVPGASEYSIFSSADLTTWILLKGGVKGTNWTLTDIEKGPRRFYRIKALR